MTTFYSSSQPRKETANVKYSVNGNKLICEVDLDQEHGSSSTGKTTKIASTHGWITVDDAGASFSLNVNRKPGSSPIVIA